MPDLTSMAVATVAGVRQRGRNHSGVHYRADIDGLRAVAVLAVVLYHAGFSAFGGGFVGVDVFFVISGYLITRIIVDEIDGGRFSLIAFYERRIRRIFPALFATLLTSAVLGAFILLPEDFQSLGQSLVAASLSASNILFWHEAGYFDAPAEQKPLLHTWSLAVEEQFYIVFPLLLLLLFRMRRSRLPWMVVALLLSFALSVWSVSNAPSSAFYLAPARIWELLIGSLLVMGALPPPNHQGTRNSLSLLGVGLIAFSVFAFSPTTPFPGASALLPCLGAGLIIHAGADGRSLIGRTLATRPLVVTGLISYSLYLWHWPLLVFAKSYVGRELTTPETLAVLALAVAVATASWGWIEQPFRGRHPVLPGLRVFPAAGVAMGAAVALGTTLHLTDGLPGRLPPDAVRVLAGAYERTPNRGECLYPPPDVVRAGDLCRVGAGERRPTFALWGDSHAEMLRTAFGEVATSAGRTGHFAGHPGCPPLLEVRIRAQSVVSSQARCSEFNHAVFDLVSSDDIDTVILAAHWSLYATGTRYGRETTREFELRDERAGPLSSEPNDTVLRRGLELTVEALVQAEKKVVIVGPIPEIAAPVPQTLARAIWFGQDVEVRPARDGFEARNRAVLAVLAALEGPMVTVVYPHSTLCDAASCRVEDGGRALYADDNHLSLSGASAIGHLLEGML